MVRKKERLSKEAFNRFFSLGRRYQSEYLTVVFQPHTTFHCAVVVSKKVAKRAVDRNRIRRRVYEIIRRMQQHDPTQGVHIVLVKAPALSLPHDALKAAVTELITKTQKVR